MLRVLMLEIEKCWAVKLRELTGSLGGAPGQRAGDVALHVSQQSQTEAWTVRHPEQDLASRSRLGGARQSVVHVDVHRGARQRLAGHHVPHQDLQGELGLWEGGKSPHLDPFVCSTSFRGNTCLRMSSINMQTSRRCFPPAELGNLSLAMKK